MQHFYPPRIGVQLALILAAAFCLQAQEAAPQSTDTKPKESLGLPPRVSALDYQTQTKVGDLLIGAEFVRHSIPTPQGPLTNEDYVSVEIGIYGPPGSHLKISMEDFTLRINGKKKNVLHEAPFGMVLQGLKDPEWAPPEPPKPKSKTSLGGVSAGGDGGGGNDPPPVVHIPIETTRNWGQRLQKAALPLGDRALPVAGVIFFLYRGRADKIDEVELNYAGPAGKATIDLNP